MLCEEGNDGNVHAHRKGFLWSGLNESGQFPVEVCLSRVKPEIIRSTEVSLIQVNVCLLLHAAAYQFCLEDFQVEINDEVPC